MSDLISRSELIKELNKYCGNQRYLVSENIREIINNQPNAYSVDKVVEELKCDRCESCNFLEVCAGSKCCGKCHEKAIEIVKQGVVSDDMCQWKKHRIIDNVQMRKTSCLYEIEERLVKKYRYCPYCGKKIKVVE